MIKNIWGYVGNLTWNLESELGDELCVEDAKEFEGMIIMYITQREIKIVHVTIASAVPTKFR